MRAAQRKGLIEWVHAVAPDLLLLQETKAHPGQLTQDLLEPSGYKTHWASAEKKGYSGVSIWTKPKPHSVVPGIGIAEYDSEGRVLTAEFDRFYLLNIYFPNGSRDEERLRYKLRFYDAILEYAERLKKTGKGLVVSGDYNTAHHPIDLARPKENEDVSGFMPIERAWLDKIEARDFVDVFRVFTPGPGHYTWWDMKTRARERNIGWRIDYHFVTRDLMPRVQKSFHMPDTQGSDHCPVGLEIDI